MKVLGIVVVGILLLVCAGGVVFGMGLLPFSRDATQTNVQAQPLQPLPTQSSDTADMVVTLSERFFNKQIADKMPAGGQVQNAEIDLHANNTANVTATVQVNSQVRVSPNASVQLGVQNGRIVVDITKVDVGGLALPNSMIEPQINQLKQTAENQLNSQLAQFEQTTGLKLQSLSTTENSLTVFFGE